MSKREMSDERKHVLRLFEEAAPDPMTPAQVAAATGKHASAMRKLMYTMLSDGQLDAGPNRGEYVLPNLSTEDDLIFEDSDDVTADFGDGNANVTDSAANVTENVTGVGTGDGLARVEATHRGGEYAANKTNLMPGMAMYCHTPPDGFPRGTYPAMKDEYGRTVPYYPAGLLPPDPNFKG